MPKRISARLALALVAVVAAACGGGDPTLTAEEPQPAASEPPESIAPTAEATPDPTPDPTQPPTPLPTPIPTPETTTFAVGDVITITQDGAPWADFTVLEVREAAQFEDPDGFYNDTPQTDGYVFIAARVRYDALTNGVDYNTFDFQVFVEGQAVDGYAFAINGPEPDLSSGTLPEGRSAEGWLLYEVPPEGEVLLSYTGNMFLDEAPVFEVVLREG